MKITKLFQSLKDNCSRYNPKIGYTCRINKISDVGDVPCIFTKGSKTEENYITIMPMREYIWCSLIWCWH